MAGKKSVREFQNEIRAEEKKMQKYGQNFNTTVKGLENNWKEHGKSVKKAAIQMRNQGINKMKEKVRGFSNEILNQKKENKAAISRMKGDVDLFVSEIDGKRKDFESYAKGPFTKDINFLISEADKKKKEFREYIKGPFADYIKAFWG